jgi:molybdopterin molybdotransferase
VLERVRTLSSERVPVSDAAGRFLAAAAAAVVDLPPFPSSAMDGYAVRRDDLPSRLPVVGRVAAGRPATRPLEAGEAMAISTGGVVPDGADVVVPVEYVVEYENEVEIATVPEPGANVRPRGGDVAAGDVVAPGGARVGIATVGALAAAGIADVVCSRRPRVAVVATGTELAPAGVALAAGQVYDANRSMLAAAAASAGAEVDVLPVVEDTESAHRAALARGLEADVLVTSGGVSVGTHDLVRRVESELGVEEVFWRVAVKPGKPVSFGVRGDTLVFGLPGNPVSSLVGFELFVRPALLALQGSAEPLPQFGRATLSRAVRRNPGRDEFLRARLHGDGDGALAAEPLSGQDSHMIARAAQADALVYIARGEGEVQAETLVPYLRLA